jgi:DNA helicase-2/ATP-dependent DNA helicase PcrA
LDLRRFNTPQREAILHGEGPLLVLAGAGSGKTRVIVHRIEYLVKERGIPVSNILAVTFTNKAAGEMRERLEYLLDDDPPLVSTFHSFCAKTLRQEIPILGYSSNFSIFDDVDVLGLVKVVMRELHLDPIKLKPKTICHYIDDCKNKGLWPEQIVADGWYQEILVRAYRSYQEKLKMLNSLDFGDLINLTVKLFNDHPEVLARYQEQYRYQLIDEWQDTNLPQYHLIRQLTGTRMSIQCTGDLGQAIYSFRGSCIDNIMNMGKDFPGLRTIKLEENYRCTKKILKAANAIIANNTQNMDMALWTKNPEGKPIICATMENELDEGRFIAETIENNKLAGKMYSNHAVLYRVNALSRSIEEALLKRGIHYIVVGGFRFFDRKEIKDCLSYMRCVVNPTDDMALRRIINVPARGIGNSTLGKLEEYAGERKTCLWEVMKDLDSLELADIAREKVRGFVKLLDMLIELNATQTLSSLLKGIMSLSGYRSALKKEGSEKSLNRVENLDELLSVAAEFENTRGVATAEAFTEYAALMSSLDVSAGDRDAVTLCTLHGAKGLEYPYVFIVGCEEGLFPHERCMESLAEIEEERRLAYVGVTRGKEMVYATMAESRRIAGTVATRKPSRFIAEIPYDCRDDVWWIEEGLVRYGGV